MFQLGVPAVNGKTTMGTVAAALLNCKSPLVSLFVHANFKTLMSPSLEHVHCVFPSASKGVLSKQITNLGSGKAFCNRFCQSAMSHVATAVGVVHAVEKQFSAGAVKVRVLALFNVADIK